MNLTTDQIARQVVIWERITTVTFCGIFVGCFFALIFSGYVLIGAFLFLCGWLLSANMRDHWRQQLVLKGFTGD